MNNVKGVLLAGGLGTRLAPITTVTNKHFLPIFDKPMIYYSLSLLMLSGTRDITIVCNENDVVSYKKLLGDGVELGIQIKYSIQDKPEGIPHAIYTAIGNQNFDKLLVVLGDNFIYGRDFFMDLKLILEKKSNVAIFSQHVKNPENFGVIVSDDNNNIIDIVEKPKKFISNDAVIGIYIFDKNFSNHFLSLKKSSRNEYEIVDLIKKYNYDNIIHQKIGRGTAWFDMGSFESFYNCSSFVKTIQDRLGLLICSPHEIAFNNGWITKTILKNYIKKNISSEYSNNLKTFLNEK